MIQTEKHNMKCMKKELLPNERRGGMQWVYDPHRGGVKRLLKNSVPTNRRFPVESPGTLGHFLNNAKDLGGKSPKTA